MARKERFLVGLDVGTSKVSVIVGELMDDGSLDIIGIGLAESKGIRRGIVNNVDSAAEAIKKALDEAELTAGVEIDSVHLALSGAHVKAFNSRGVVAVAGRNREITRDDVKRAIDAARAVALPGGREILHVLPQDFVVDWGAIYAEKGEFWRKTTTGLEDRGGYASRGDGFAFTGTWSRFTLKPAASAEAASLARIAALFRERPKRGVEDWSARGKAVAPLWQADAVVQDATVDRPQADNTLGPQSTLTMRFRSATTDRLLVLRSTASGALDSFLLAP